MQDWVAQKATMYLDHDNFTGSGDKGRDVVGFLTRQRHEGAWHNYQCKQYNKTITADLAILEIGKILYYASCGEFTVPEKYFFVAPKGINRTLEKLINNPSQFKEILINEWVKYCEKKIIKNSLVNLNDKLLETINSYDFSSIKALKANQLLSDPDINAVLHKWFNHDPGMAPRGTVPLEVENSELEYVKQLVFAYGERLGKIFSSHKEIEDLSEHHEHFKRQRVRFYDADAFKRYYRDNTSIETVKRVQDDIYDSVVDACCSIEYKDTLTKITNILSEVTHVVLSGDLAPYASSSVKQGMCHHLVNEGELKWKI